MRNKKIVFSNIFTLLIISFSSLFSNSLAVFIFSTVIFIIGHLYALSIEKNKRDNAIYSFSIVLSALIIFATIYFFHTEINYEKFALEWKDEYKFWQMSQELSNLTSINEIFNEAYSFWRYHELPGYVFYIGSLGYIAESFFDGNNLLIQFLGSVLWGSLSTLILYKIFLIYFQKNDAVKYVLYFSLLSVVFSYSFFLLRDIIILFFYLLVFYIIIRKFSWAGLLKLLIISFIVWQIRLEHGLFVIVFSIYYLFNKFKNNKIILLFLIIAFVLIISSMLYDYFLKATSTINYYSDFSETSALEVDDSLGKYIYFMPSPLKELFRFINSQLQPFPSWNALSNSSDIYLRIVNFLPIIYTYFWFVVVFSLFKWFIIKRKYKSLSKDLILLFIIVLTFLIVVTMGSGGVRRIMCVYPFVYLIYCLLKSKMNNKYELMITNFQAFISYIDRKSVV